MVILQVMDLMDSFVGSARSANQKALSSGLFTDEREELFKSIESKFISVKNTAGKWIEFEKGDYKYVTPNQTQMKPVLEDVIKDELSILKSKVEAFKEKMDNTYYKVVDDSTNKISYLGNTPKTNLKKAIADIENLISLY